MKQADREASNAIVAQAGFYAGALARAHAENEQHEKTIAVLAADKKARDEELHSTRVDKESWKAENDKLMSRLKSVEEAAGFDRRKLADAGQEIARLTQKNTDLGEQLTTVNRALVESHHERDGLQKKLHDSGEAIGFMKGNANAFVRDLRAILTSAGYVCESPGDITEALKDLAERAGPKKSAAPNYPKKLYPG